MSDEKKLKPYFVEYTLTAVVMAEDENDAYSVAMDERRDIMYESSDVPAHVMGEVKSAADLRDGWDVMCIPYGGDGNTRIGELLAAK